MLATSTHGALADQYLDRLAFGWQRRSHAACSHVIDFGDLSVWDNSLHACVQGLTLTGPASIQLIQSRLEDSLSKGEFFAIALHAINIQDAKIHSSCIGLVQSLERLREVYRDALAWSSLNSARWALAQWAPTYDVRDVHAAPGGHWSHGTVTLLCCQIYPELLAENDHGGWLSELSEACTTTQADPAQPQLASALMRLALVNGKPALVQAAELLLTSPIANLRCLAAQVLLWQPKQQRTPAMSQKAIDALLALVSADTPADEEQASQAAWALACWRFADFDVVLATLATRPDGLDTYLRALGWSGSMQKVPLLMSYLDDPKYARLAGASLSMLTGSLPARDGWQAEPVDSPLSEAEDGSKKENLTSTAIPAAKPYADLPPPDTAGFERWWSGNRKNFGSANTWLAGLPDSNSNLTNVLQCGKLAWRSVAARRVLAATGGHSLDVRAPAYRQRQWMANITNTST